MPVLSNPRHERFAQELAKGKSATQAYVAAGLDRRPAKGAEGFYVYLLIDPRDDRVFYIGKGKGRRASAHWAAMARGLVKNVVNHERLTAIRSEGFRVEEACFADGMSSDAAYALEQALIRTVGFAGIANVLPGITTQNARMLAEVKTSIARIKPYLRWCVEMQPSDEQKRLYWQVVIHYHRLRRRLEAKLGLRCPVALAR